MRENFPRWGRHFTNEELSIVYSAMLTEDIEPFNPTTGARISGTQPDRISRRKWRRAWRRASAWKTRGQLRSMRRNTTRETKQQDVLDWLWNERGLREIFEQIDVKKRQT